MYRVVTRVLREARKSNERAQLITYQCKLVGDCPLLNQGQCIHLHLLGPYCVYGHASCEESPTMRAAAYRDVVRTWRGLTAVAPVKPAEDVLAYIGEYVYLPYAFMSHNDGEPNLPFLAYSHIFSGGSPFMLREKFTPEMIVKLVEFRPRSLMGCEAIPDYPNVSVPQFLLDLSALDPELFRATAHLKPEIDDIMIQAGRNTFSASDLKALQYSGHIQIDSMDCFHYSRGSVKAMVESLPGFPAEGQVEVHFYPKPDAQCTVVDRESAIKIANWIRRNR